MEKGEYNMKWGNGLVVLCMFAFLLILMPATAVFEVPEGAITFESLGLSETYNGDTSIYQTKEVTLPFSEPSEINIVIYTFRRDKSFIARIYVNGRLATAKPIDSDYKETAFTIPDTFIENSENSIYLEIIAMPGYYEFSEYPITIAPKSYILSPNGPTQTHTITTIQMESLGFAIIDIQKSSKTSPEINIEPIDKQELSNTTFFLNGSASSDSGIKSVTVNGQYAGTENWIAPIDSSGDGNIVIIAEDNDGNITIQNINTTIYNINSNNSSSESEFKSNPNIGVIIGAIIGAIGTIVAAIIIINEKKSNDKKMKQVVKLRVFILPITGTLGLLINEFIFGWGTTVTLTFAALNVLGLAILAYMFWGMKKEV